MENLFKLEAHPSCYFYKTDSESGFKYGSVESGKCADIMNAERNYLVFLLSGTMEITCSNQDALVLKSNECVLLPHGSSMFFKVLRKSDVLVFAFDSLSSVCDKAMMERIRSQASKAKRSFCVMILRPPLHEFMSLLGEYLELGINCEHLHEIKERELFLLFRQLYNEDELARFFAPLSGASDFKGFILENYRTVRGIAELARMSGMGRTAFDCKFKDIFGKSARQWMLQQTAQHIRYRIMDPDVTAKDLMNEFKFNSATHFNRFCRNQFGCTPGQLLRQSRKTVGNL
jgi:AraC-like DNA-binding protein